MDLLQPYGRYILIALIAIAGIAILAWVSVVLIVMRNTQGIPLVISNFFELVSQYKIDEAYLATTDSFRSRISKPQFRKLIKNNKFKQYQRTSLGIPNMKTGNEAIISAKLILKSEREIPLEFRVARQNKQWKIDRLELV